MLISRGLLLFICVLLIFALDMSEKAEKKNRDNDKYRPMKGDRS